MPGAEHVDSNADASEDEDPEPRVKPCIADRLPRVLKDSDKLELIFELSR